MNHDIFFQTRLYKSLQLQLARKSTMPISTTEGHLTIIDRNKLFHLRKTCSIVRLIVSNTVITKNKGKQIANSNFIISSILHVLLSYCIVGNLKSKKYELVLCLIMVGPLTTNL